MSQVWIVLEGPDMTYYGSAEIHGVYATEEEARVRCDALNGGESHDWDSITVENWEIGESSDREPPEPHEPNPDAPALGGGYAAMLVGLYGAGGVHSLLGASVSSPQTAELKRRRWRRR